MPHHVQVQGHLPTATQQQRRRLTSPPTTARYYTKIWYCTQLVLPFMLLAVLRAGPTASGHTAATEEAGCVAHAEQPPAASGDESTAVEPFRSDCAGPVIFFCMVFIVRYCENFFYWSSPH